MPGTGELANERDKAPVGALSLLQAELKLTLAVPAITWTSSGQGMFRASVVAGRAYVASPIPCLVSLEVVERPRSTFRNRAVISVPRVKAVVNVAEKSVRAVEPGAGSKEYSANEPVRPIVAVRCAVVRSIVEIPIGANWLDSNTDGNLGWPKRCTAEKCNRENRES